MLSMLSLYNVVTGINFCFLSFQLNTFIAKSFFNFGNLKNRFLSWFVYICRTLYTYQNAIEFVIKKILSPKLMIMIHLVWICFLWELQFSTSFNAYSKFLLKVFKKKIVWCHLKFHQNWKVNEVWEKHCVWMYPMLR